jgi:hypothetical protein
MRRAVSGRRPSSAETTLVVILGASIYPRKPASTNPVLGASAAGFRDYVVSGAGMAIPPEQLLDLSHDGKTGSYAELMSPLIVVTEVTPVVPSDKGDQWMGYLSVTRSVALAPAIQPLIDAGITDKLVFVDGGESPIGVMPASATTIEHPLASQDGAKIVAARSLPQVVVPPGLLGGGIAAMVIGLVALVISLLRRDWGRRGATIMDPDDGLEAADR